MKKSAAVGVGAVVGIALLAAGVVAGGAIASILPSSQSQAGPAPYETNSAGETFGSNLGSKSPESDPDLILAIGDHGKEGYLRSTDLNEPAPSSPEEAVATQTKPGEVHAVLSLYASDGRTVVGSFTVLGGESETVVGGDLPVED